MRPSSQTTRSSRWYLTVSATWIPDLISGDSNSRSIHGRRRELTTATEIASSKDILLKTHQIWSESTLLTLLPPRKYWPSRLLSVTTFKNSDFKPAHFYIFTQSHSNLLLFKPQSCYDFDIYFYPHFYHDTYCLFSNFYKIFVISSHQFIMISFIKSKSVLFVITHFNSFKKSIMILNWLHTIGNDPTNYVLRNLDDIDAGKPQLFVRIR